MKPDIFRKRGEYYLDPGPGDMLSDAFNEAMQAIPALGRPITVIFNGTPVTVVDGMDKNEAHRQWGEIREELQAQSRRDPGGTDAFWGRLRAEERRLDQAVMDQLVCDALDTAIAGGIGGLIEWTKDYAGLYNSELDNCTGEVQKKLKAAGYNPCPRADEPPQDFKLLGGYIIGRVLDIAAHGGTLPRLELYPLCDALSGLQQSQAIPLMRPLTLKPIKSMV